MPCQGGAREVRFISESDQLKAGSGKRFSVACDLVFMGAQAQDELRFPVSLWEVKAAVMPRYRSARQQVEEAVMLCNGGDRTFEGKDVVKVGNLDAPLGILPHIGRQFVGGKVETVPISEWH
eukprot:2813382-Karenia_brevis.AAC.1